MLNLIQHLTNSKTYETLKQVQGDKLGLFTPAAESLSRFKRERMNAPTFGRPVPSPAGDVAPLGR